MKAGRPTRCVSWRLPALLILVLAILFGPSLTSVVSAQPSCQPRPRVVVISSSDSSLPLESNWYRSKWSMLGRSRKRRHSAHRPSAS